MLFTEFCEREALRILTSKRIGSFIISRASFSKRFYDASVREAERQHYRARASIAAIRRSRRDFNEQSWLANGGS